MGTSPSSAGVSGASADTPPPEPCRDGGRSAFFLSAHLCWLCSHGHETPRVFTPAWQQSCLLELGGGWRRGTPARAGSCLPAAGAANAAGAARRRTTQPCGAPASSSSASTPGHGRKLGALREDWRHWGRTMKPGSEGGGWRFHGGSCWEVGKSLGNQAGDHAAGLEGRPAALPRQGLRWFEAIADWQTCLSLEGREQQLCGCTSSLCHGCSDPTACSQGWPMLDALDLSELWTCQ